MKTNIITPYIIDTTLRDGEQAPGVVFSPSEKLHIAQLLDKLGIEEIEAGSPFVHESEIKTIKSIVNSGFKYRISCWSRARFDDIDTALKTGAEGINISFPVSDIQLSAIGKNRKWVFELLPEIIEYAKKRFKYVSLGAQDASRASADVLNEYLKVAEKNHIFRVRIADTVGVLNPLSTFKIISNLKKLTKQTHLEFHGHNDLGMATANSISAFQAGAACTSATINGIGERAGNAAIEELIMAMNYSLKLNTDYNPLIINDLCKFTSEASGREIPLMKPISGEMAFKHETGIHINSLLKDTRSYQLFNPEEVGMKSNNFVFGIHSGSAALIDFLRKKSIKINGKKVYDILNKVKSQSYISKRSLSEDEIEQICNSIQL